MGPLRIVTSSRGVHTLSQPPRLLKLRSSKAFIVTTICVVIFTDIFLYGVIVPVIPFSLPERQGIAPDDVQEWVGILLAVYGAALLVGSPVAGWYADNSSSRRMPLLIGLVALAGSTVMLCLARNVELLIAGRILQGLSSAVAWTVVQALLVDTVGQKEIGEVLGYLSISLSLGIFFAPLLGGVVYQRAGYYAVFYMSFVLVACDIILRLLMIEKKIALQWADVVVLENAISPQAQSPGAEEAKEATDGIPPVDSSSPIDSFAGPEETASQATESPPYLEPSPHHNYSKLPPVLRLLSSRRLLAALWGCTVQATLTTTFDSVLPIFVKESFEWDSIGGGLVFLAFIIPSFGAPIVGKISDRYGPRWLAVGGFIFSIPFWILLRFVDHNSLNQKVLLCALLSLIGVGLVLVMSPLMAEITYVVEAKEKKNPGLYGSNGAYAQAYALFVMAFAAGTLIGPIWGGYVVKAAGWGTMTWSLSLLSLSGAVPVLIWTGGLITRDNAKTGDERAIGAPAMVNVMAIESDIEKQI